MGEAGLQIMAEVRDKFGMKIVTEAIDNESLELVEKYADVIQIGARNMQNFSLLKHAGRARKPVLLKRGMSATLEEFLMAAEYVMSEGNYKVILCERGVRTFADHTRNTLDLSIVPAVQRLSHLPIVVDPSHGTGKRNKVTPLSRAAIAVGADGLIVEVHHEPDRAMSDGIQSLYPEQFDELMRQVRQIAPVVGRTVPAIGTHAPGPCSVRPGVGPPSAHQLEENSSPRRHHPVGGRAWDGGTSMSASALVWPRLSRVRLHHQWQEQHRFRNRSAHVSAGQDDPGRQRAYRNRGQQQEKRNLRRQHAVEQRQRD